MDFKTAKPDDICGWIQKTVRRVAGDEVENKTEIYARNGHYFIFFPLHAGLAAVRHVWRRSELAKKIRRRLGLNKREAWLLMGQQSLGMGN